MRVAAAVDVSGLCARRRIEPMIASNDRVGRFAVESWGRLEHLAEGSIHEDLIDGPICAAA